MSLLDSKVLFWGNAVFCLLNAAMFAAHGMAINGILMVLCAFSAGLNAKDSF